jgi:hypothetical protein
VSFLWPLSLGGFFPGCRGVSLKLSLLYMFLTDCCCINNNMSYLKDRMSLLCCVLPLAAGVTYTQDEKAVMNLCNMMTCFNCVTISILLELY